MKRLAAIPLLLASTVANAIVVRHDVPDSAYLVHDGALQALVDLPHEGHGVLIGSRWVLTAAHSTQWHPITEVMLNEPANNLSLNKLNSSDFPFSPKV